MSSEIVQQTASDFGDQGVGAAKALLQECEIDAIALTYIDNAGVARVKAIPVERLDAVMHAGVGMSPVFDAFLFNDAITQSRFSGDPIGDLRLFPDLNSLAPIAAMPGWAFAAVERFDQSRRPHPNCSRGFLHRQMDLLGEQGIDVRVGFEIEWALSSATDTGFTPATDGAAYGLSRIVDLSGYAREIIVNLRKSGLVVEQFHPEYAPGQFEVSLSPLSPLQAVDQLVLAKTVIRATGKAHALRTSFAPVVEVDGVGNGGHVHLSASYQATPVFGGGEGPGGLTKRGEGIVATLLDWLPGLLVLGAPSPVSYLRLVPSHWAGAYQCWGIENREAALRLVATSPLVAPTSANLEIKCFDQSANPYLLLGALLVGLGVSIGQERTPNLPDPVGSDPASLPDAIRLPQSLATSIAEFQKLTPLLMALGEELTEAFIAVREAELAHFERASPAEIIAETRWVY